MNKRYIFLLLLCCVLSINSTFAQDDKLSQFTFDDIPTDEAKPPYFAVAGGFLATGFFLKLDDVNSRFVSPLLGGETFSSPMILTGWQGFAAIGIIPNIRIGFMNQSGSLLKEKQVGSLTRRVEYSVGMNGFSVDYGINLSRGLSFLPGITIGWGNLTLEASQATSSSAQSIDSVFAFGSGRSDYHNYARASYLSLQPNLNLEYAFALFSMIRLNVGYSLSFMGDWKSNALTPVHSVPTSMNASGLTVQVGLFLGLFNN